MKKNLLIASAIAAGTATLIYYIRKRRAQKNADTPHHAFQRTHHVTNVFAKAKMAEVK